MSESSTSVDDSCRTPRPCGQAATQSTLAVPRADHLISLDAYRGLAMVLMAAEGLALPQVAKQFPDSRVWQTIGFHAQHVPWEGCSLWDLIQPSFIFMVGVAAAYSYASRRSRGQSPGALAWRAASRALVLILIGVMLPSQHATRTTFIFTNVLAQIGLGYFFLFLLCGRSARAQWIAAGVLLAGDWLLFAVYPAPPRGFDFLAVGVPDSWPHLSGFAAHWDKNANVAAAFDVWFLNLFPREQPFVFNKGGYQTLNCIPSLVTMIFGLLAGELLRGSLPAMQKFRRLAGCGLAGMAAGCLWSFSGTCPLVKHLWTPSWTLFSAGIASALLGCFYLAIDVRGWRRWTLPLVVVGMNSILMYVMAELLPEWISRTVQVHFGSGIFERFGDRYAPLAAGFATLALLWLVCYWLYRRKIFIRI